MRVISGKYKGRSLTGFTIAGTRPTQDRVKESIFSMIGDKVKDAIVLDLFAGSGNLGIEALSNGASYAYFIDHSKESCRTIQKNLQALGIKEGQVEKIDYKKALINFSRKKIKFDLVFLDPPYQNHVLDEILRFLEKGELLEEEAWIICEYEQDQTQEKYNTLELVKQKKYGYKNVKIYEKIKSEKNLENSKKS